MLQVHAGEPALAPDRGRTTVSLDTMFHQRPRQVKGVVSCFGDDAMAFTIDYDDAIHLDAEALAEGGIGQGYEAVLPKLRELIKNPAKIEEHRDDDSPSYSVSCGDTTFEIYGPDLEEEQGNSWARATVALFSIVNGQLENSTHRFYALNSGNDLFGIFLTPAQATEAQKSLSNKSYWPYLPKDEEPYYGQHH